MFKKLGMMLGIIGAAEATAETVQSSQCQEFGIDDAPCQVTKEEAAKKRKARKAQKAAKKARRRNRR